MRREFLVTSLLVTALFLALGYFYSSSFFLVFIFIGPVLLLGFYDYFQTKHTIRRNFPVMGHFRYILESIRPEINQYFIESNSDGQPFSRESRSVVYQRAKLQLDTIPFGTQKDVYANNYEFINHSLDVKKVDPLKLRMKVGGPQCKQVYDSSLFNISAMSYGSLSSRAIEALSSGAKMGTFYHNTGEGGISPFHEAGGGDLTWQIGTGYFGARTKDGNFCEQSFAEKSQKPCVKMIEVKLSQGAKPGHGGILPGKKVTPEIAKIRGVEVGKTVDSPPYHRAFNTPVGLVQFLAKLRELSGGKPVGFKICIGKRREFISICKAMIQLDTYPDFITIDGAEGGTGAAPLEFANHIGLPALDGVVFAHNCLTGFGLRDKIKIISAGKVTTGFGLLKHLSVGADLVNAGRSFMLALGCIQALRCHNNMCPTGVATMDPNLVGGINVKDKSYRVYNYHKETLDSAAHLLGAMGLESTQELGPWHILKRSPTGPVNHYAQIYDYIEKDSLLGSTYPEGFDRIMATSSPETFARI